MGRRARSNDGPSTAITVRLTESELEQLAELMIRHQQTSRSDMLRLALRAMNSPDRPQIWPSQVLDRLEARLANIVAYPIREEETLFTAEELTTLARPKIEKRLVPLLMKLIRTHIQHHGWPLPVTTNSMEDVLLSVQAARVSGPLYSGSGRTGVDFLKSHFMSFWNTHRGPIESVQDTPRFERLLRHMTGLSTAEQSVDFTWKTFRRAFGQQHIAVSFFRPSVAAGIYARWLEGKDAPMVWDPSGGFGARMLGFFAVFPHGSYFAHEPATLTHADLCRLGEVMPGEVHVEKAGSEFAVWGANKFDLVFTSPPYFNLERYFDEPGQVWVEYKTQEQWRNKQLIPTFRAAYTGLKPGAFAIFNVHQTHRDEFLSVAEEVGFEFTVEEELLLSRGPLAQTTSMSNHSAKQIEPILVFRKPNST